MNIVSAILYFLYILLCVGRYHDDNGDRKWSFRCSNLGKGHQLDYSRCVNDKMAFRTWSGSHSSWELIDGYGLVGFNTEW